MKKRWSLFTYPMMDIKAAQAELCRRAKAGWRLEKIWAGYFACFVPAEKPVTYFVDWTDPLGDTAEGDYLALLKEAGWTLVQRLDHWNIYEAPAGTAPIQTDSALEFQRFQDKTLRWMKFSAGVTLAALVLECIILFGQPEGARFPLALLSQDNLLCVGLFLLPFSLLGGLFFLARLGLRLLQWWRAARDGEPFPVPGPVSVAVGKAYSILGMLLVVVSAAAMALDSLTGGGMRAQLIIVAGAVFYLIFYKREMPQKQRARFYEILLLVMMAPALVVGLTFGPVASGLMMEAPLAEAQVLPKPEDSAYEEEGVAAVATAGKAIRQETTATFLLSHTGWEEKEFSMADLMPNMPPSEREVYQTWDAWTARWGWLADQIQSSQITPDMAPAEGYEGVWTSGEVWLIRRGDTLLRVESGVPAEVWLDGALAQMEGEGTV